MLNHFLFQFETADDQYPSESQAQLRLSTEVYQSVNQRYLYIDLPSLFSSYEVEHYANIKIHFSYRDYLPLTTFSYQVTNTWMDRFLLYSIYTHRSRLFVDCSLYIYNSVYAFLL